MFGRIGNFVRSEPVATAAFLAAAIACGTSFGLHWSADQVAGVETLWAAASGLFVRQAVTPTVNQSAPVTPTVPPAA